MKTINPALVLFVVAFSFLFYSDVAAQQRKIPKAPFLITDAATNKPIPEVLVIPRYTSFHGVSTLLGEGPGKGTDRDYLDKPFVYRTGEPFKLKLPKSGGLPLIPFVFIGTGRSIQDVLFIAPHYRPHRVSDLWSTGMERRLQLNPISEPEWRSLLEKELSSLMQDSATVGDNCRFWDLPDKCTLIIYYDQKERDLVKAFLR